MFKLSTLLENQKKSIKIEEQLLIFLNVLLKFQKIVVKLKKFI